MSNILLQASGPNVTYNIRSGSKTADGNGIISIPPYGDDLKDLLAEGCVVIGYPSYNTANFRNMIDGGDFQVNPWQRGTTALTIANTLTYGPDRFFGLGGASSSIYLTKTANTDVAGFTQSCAFGRTSGNTDTHALNMGQVLESLDCYKCAGQPVTLSFWAKAGANYSGGAVTVALYSGTAADDTAANMASGSWTGSATPINATFTPTNTNTRYQFTGTVAALAKQLGILLTWTPTGTAGTADNVLINGVQLELGESASPFEFRDAEVELALAQRYFYAINEPASGVIVGAGMISTTNNETVYIPFPTPMRKAPTVTVTAGTFKFNIAGTATAVGGGFAGGTTHTPNAMSIVGAVTATVGQATLLQGGGGTGTILASADY